MNKKKLALSLLISSLCTAGNAYADNDRYVLQVDNSKKGIIKALTKKLGGDINVDGNGFLAVTFSGHDLASVQGLLNNPHITLIEEDYKRVPLAVYNDDLGNPTQQQITPYAVYQSQADLITFDANAGMKVCVIDSGLDNSNSDFVWGNITGNNDSGTGNWYEHGGPHGTHVAGTIGAADNNQGVIGMAPGVAMHIIKVFNEAGWGYSSDLAHAADLCAQAGANIINMSLGGGGANTTESNAFANFTNAGGLVVAAAGNDGNNVRSYPAGYSSVMMVGANDANNAIADFSQYPSCSSGRGKRATNDETICVEVTAGGVDTLSTYPAGLASSANLAADSIAYASSAMENTGDVTASAYYMGTAESTDNNAAGKVCLIDRGAISFYDKVANCENSNGIGAVIINNEAGMLYGTLGESNDTNIPAVGAAFEDRSALLASTSVSVNIGSSDYGFMSGTSMATPAVAGVAALVWSNHPHCTGTEIRDALKATAQDQGATGKDDYFGYGIVKAADADMYLTTNGCAGSEQGGGDPIADEIVLSANGYKSKGNKFVDLSWSGAATSQVDIYRNGTKVTSTANNNSYTDAIAGKGGGTYSYQVCEAENTNVCSTNETVVF